MRPRESVYEFSGVGGAEAEAAAEPAAVGEVISGCEAFSAMEYFIVVENQHHPWLEMDLYRVFLFCFQLLIKFFERVNSSSCQSIYRLSVRVVSHHIPRFVTLKERYI